ncbi:MAG: hypothetical protein KDE27_21505, partial [Planctomycetes bacterium]|nr:hypothetical protein [Planctomycetota bacterium]
HGPGLAPHTDFAGEADFGRELAALRVGRRAPNPLYAHLFAAFERDRRCPELALPDLEAQIGSWLPWADPLEQRPIAFGLTPYGTYTRLRQNVIDHLAREPLPIAPHYGALRLRNDEAALARVRSFLADLPELPTRELAPAELRELWILLFSFDSLFVTTE